MSSPKGKETKQRQQEKIPTYWRYETPWQGLCTALFVLALGYTSLEGDVPHFSIVQFHTYSINPNHKLTCLLSFPFNPCAADFAHLGLW